MEIEMRPTVVLPVSRARALTRAIVWSVPAVICGLIAYLVYTRLHFTPSAISNRLVDYGVALISLPIPILAVWATFRAVRWALLALWPGTVAIVASESAMTFYMGPFGTKRFDAARMVIRYPFELLENSDDDAGFEGYLPQEEQRRLLLPRITHPDSIRPLNELILQYADLDEREAAAAIRPVVDYWRTRATVPSA